MKPFHKKLIVLSMAALVLAGTGCERRGRAPVQQKKTDQGGVVKTDGTQTTVTNKTDEKKTEEKKEEKKDETPVTASELEKSLIAKSAMSCSISVNEKEVGTETTFKPDVTNVIAFFRCLGASAGVKFHENKAAKRWEIWNTLAEEEAARNAEAAASGKQVPKIPGNALAEEFAKLAKEKNDEDAETILLARLDLFNLNAEKIKAKYAKLPQDKEIAIAAQQALSPAGIIEDLSTMIEAANAAKEFVKKQSTVVNGEDKLTNASFSGSDEDEVDAE